MFCQTPALTMYSVVFSFWTSTLDIIEECLVHEGIKFTRFDGKVTNQQRGKILNSIHEDPTVRVSLMSLSCGGVG